MHETEISPAWGYGITVAICFFGWILLTIFVDGINTRAEASRAVSEAIIFTALAGVIPGGIWAGWRSCRVERRTNPRRGTVPRIDGND
jgi:hypothetical protein